MIWEDLLQVMERAGPPFRSFVRKNSRVIFFFFWKMSQMRFYFVRLLKFSAGIGRLGLFSFPFLSPLSPRPLAWARPTRCSIFDVLRLKKKIKKK